MPVLEFKQTFLNLVYKIKRLKMIIKAVKSISQLSIKKDKERQILVCLYVIFSLKEKEENDTNYVVFNRFIIRGGGRGGLHYAGWLKPMIILKDSQLHQSHTAPSRLSTNHTTRQLNWAGS